MKFGREVSVVELAAVVVPLIIGYVAISVLSSQARRRSLLEKYAGDEQVVDMIMRRMMWQGMSSEQLRDSLGAPVAVDRKIFKTKVAETYKYQQSSRNRFRPRVKLENDIVVGWEQR